MGKFILNCGIFEQSPNSYHYLTYFCQSQFANSMPYFISSKPISDISLVADLNMNNYCPTKTRRPLNNHQINDSEIRSLIV